VSLTDITIVGGGPVGLFGCFYAGLRGMSVRVIDSLDDLGGQMAALYPEKFIYDMPGFPEVIAKDLTHAMVRQAGRFSPAYVLGETCERLERTGSSWTIHTQRGSYPTKTVVICAGLGAFSPTRIGVDREEDYLGQGLMYGVKVKAALAGKRVVVVGGGDSALDWALGLEDIAREVTLVHRRDGFRAHEESIERLGLSTVRVRLWEVVVGLSGTGNLEGVTVENKKSGERHEIACDVLTVNIGFKSSLGPIRTWGVQLEKNKIVVDPLMRTNLEGVFAAGDVCTHEGKLDLIATGVGEVCTAVNVAKSMIDPSAKAFPGHSSDMKLPPLEP
jgi:thioredoxin reductase (NADPH)